ncbi:nitroreductase [Sulfitobacter sp. S190]|uniref:nitroreductase n=1 Tax=Sulfitobacter sp. S190 TaxID=2867022 RepID=UPI0021A65002|nr:nitroreductase [Sulfitobacter sp. S190]UWR21565.1 nitroreductase [Sulfitobacter sp. S190]
MTQLDTLYQIMTARHSCRAFRPDPVSRTVLQQIVQTAQRAPSWCNAQPWRLSLTEAEGTERLRRKLAAAAAEGTPPTPDLDWPTGYSGAYAERRRTCGFQLYEAVGIDRSDRAGRQAQMLRNYALFDAPHVAIVHSPAELGPYGAMDCGGFVTAFTLAATAAGVASIPQAAIAAYAPLLRTELGIGDDRLILCAISLGYADTDHPANGFRTHRADPADVVDWVTA